jgi:hypothetical protein
MQLMRVANPSESYTISLPDDVTEDYDGRVASFWKDGQSLLLQMSSYLRYEGTQVCAADRLDSLLKQVALQDVSRNVSISIDSPDVEAAVGFDADGVKWIYIFAVWLDLAILISISGAPLDFVANNNWAFNAIRSIRRISHFDVL